MKYTKKKGLKNGQIFVSQNIQWDRGRGIRKKGILHPSIVFQNTRILEIIKIFVSHHKKSMRYTKKKGLENGQIFVSQNIE